MPSPPSPPPCNPPHSSPSNDTSQSSSSSSSLHPVNQHQSPPQQSLSIASSVKSSWTQFTQLLHDGISKFVLTLSLTAARNPTACINLVSITSVFLVVTGLLTNFELSLDSEEIYAPNGCRFLEHWNYATNLQGFPTPMRPLVFVVHADGGNVMEHPYESMHTVFQVTELVKNLPGYQALCESAECGQQGATRYWEHNQTRFEVESQGSDQIVRDTLSQEEFFSARSYMMGHYRQDDPNSTLITYAESLFGAVEFIAGENGEGEVLELDIIDVMLELRESLLATSNLRLDFYTWRSVPDEVARAVGQDLPLIPFVFIIMTAFSCLIFWRNDKVQSRALLGLGSVVTIVFSIMSGYGIAFIIGIPFTSMTQILPFVIFGVGLDDTFIITGAYFRTSPSKDPVERIRETMEEVGSSIFLTTTTTTIAFILGCISSSVPGIQWICLYAFPTILIDFIYQITFFVAILVLDERRIQANRRDCCIWVTVEGEDEPNETTGQEDGGLQDSAKSKAPMITDRIMKWYSEHLLRPRVKVAVLVVFAAFTAFCIYSATLLEQDFRPSEFLPDDSYAYAFIDSSSEYTTQKLQVKVYFRHVDQSDPEIQRQMIEYMEDLEAMPQVNRTADFCWVRDFQKMKDGSDPVFEQYSYLFDSNMTFTQQLDLMFAVPQIKELYGLDIARDENGNIEASRCTLVINGVDLDIVQEQIKMLADQRAISAAQPINQGREDFAFFNVDLLYYIWEFYAVAVDELAFTTISGVVAVSFIAFVLIPHKTAILFVLPMMLILYVDLLGTLQFIGLSINPLTYICLVMSIGLLVDFLLHLILRYYESAEKTRDGKVKDTLQTMGASILVGGLSTIFGVVPLAFSSSGIIKIVFNMFFAMVALGLANGLILLPVILSYVGPTVCVRMTHHQHQTKASDEFMSIQTAGSNSFQGMHSREPSCADSSASPSSSPSTTPSNADHDMPLRYQSGMPRSLMYEDGAWIRHIDTEEEIEV